MSDVSSRVAVRDSSEPLSVEPTAAGHPGSDATPEKELLTPELFADESRRGDFVIALVTVLVGFLLAMFKISDVPFWGHLAMGRYIVGNGPPHSDPFSYVAEGQPAVNPHWLTEAAIYSLYSTVGPSMLVFIKALGGALLIVLLLGIRHRGPTLWWTACGAAFVLALTGQEFIVGPEFITVLGVAAYLALLHRIRHRNQPQLMWLFVPLQILWVNLDERAFVGALVVALFVIGELAARGLSAARADRLAPKHLTQLAVVFVLMLVGSLLNPYGLHVLTYPFHLYGSMNPALVDYWQQTHETSLLLIGLFDRLNQLTDGGTLRSFLQGLRPLELANLGLLLAAGVSFVLNRTRFDLVRLVILVGFILLASLSLGNLALLTVAAAFVLVLNGQEWYLDRFGAEPRLETPWVVWSRAGRAVTVLALAAMAVFGSAGWLRGTNGYDFGLGVNPLMEESLAEINEQLDELPAGFRGFNFTLDQATVLCWLVPPEAQPAVYMNDGMALYASAGGSDWRGYLQLRQQLAYDNKEFWGPLLDQYGVNYVMLSMNPPPMLEEFAHLTLGPNWTAVTFGGALAMLVRADARDEGISDYRETHRVSFSRAAFRENREPPPAPDRFVEKPWLYDSLWRTRQVVPDSIGRAASLWQLPRVLSRQGVRLSLSQASTFDLLAIRNLRAALASRYVDNPTGYLLLANAYEDLLILESELTRQQLAADLTPDELQRLPAIRQPHNVRFYQLLTALNQAVTADPSSTRARGKLAYWYSRAGHLDLALEQYQELLPLLEDEQEKASANEAIVRLTDQVERTRVSIDEQRRREEQTGGESDTLALARRAGDAGCYKLAIELCDSQSYGVFDPDIQLVLAHIYTQIGKPVQALEKLNALEAYKTQLGPKLDELSGTTLLLQGYYKSAVARWERAIDLEQVQTANNYLFTLRDMFAQARPMPFFEQTTTAAEQPLRTASGLLHWGMVLMEAGQVEQAAERLKESLDTEPEAPFRALAAFYYNRLSDETVDPYRPSDYLPVEFADANGEP